MVSITALSGVGVAAVVGVGVCAGVLELNINADAITASAVSKTFPRRIAFSLHFGPQGCRRQ
jgi:hypothetical protein